MDEQLKTKRCMTVDEWMAERHPPGVWIDLGPRDNPAKHQCIPGTRYDSQRDATIYKARDGSEVLGLTRPHPLVD